jgi:hypothetical protein
MCLKKTSIQINVELIDYRKKDQKRELSNTNNILLKINFERDVYRKNQRVFKLILYKTNNNNS